MISDYFRQQCSRLIIQKSGFTIKVEPNHVIRGTVFLPQESTLNKRTQDLFETSVIMQILSFEDLYGGKICAALDRQHPRDLFDIKFLLDNEGITDKIRQAFIVYLISHSRPIVELLNPNLKDIKSIFENEFRGMALTEVPLEKLETVRVELIKQINASLTEEERKFILFFKRMEPEWNLLQLDGVEDLPAIKWKKLNLERMEKKKHRKAVERLRRQLQI